MVLIEVFHVSLNIRYFDYHIFIKFIIIFLLFFIMYDRVNL
jgi:hypothetical protein